MIPTIATLVLAGCLATQIKPFGPIPSARQLAWHELEIYAFAHFGPNTFSGLEWGHGTEDPKSFNPSKLDCRQWARTLKAGGMRGIIITAKHHDGFCLWSSKESTHTVAQSDWKQGKGDVLRELSAACNEVGLKFGVYLSPWDRNHPQYGTPGYNQVFARMLREVLTRYGPVFEVWFDGANGEGPNGKQQVYDWDLFVRTVRECQPHAVIFSDAGPDIRWVGNEDGFAGETNWATLNRKEFYPGTPNSKPLTTGQMGGTDWLPAECDVSIRPGWFWRASEDAKVKSVADLMAIWYGSVGRGANLLLNVPPNADGLIAEPDARRLIEFREGRESALKTRLKVALATASESVAGCAADAVIDGKPQTCWAAPGPATLTLHFASEQEVDHVELSEPIQLGQRIQRFEVAIPGHTKPLVEGTTIGPRRLVRFNPVRTKLLEIRVIESLAPPAIGEVRLYRSGKETS